MKRGRLVDYFFSVTFDGIVYHLIMFAVDPFQFNLYNLVNSLLAIIRIRIEQGQMKVSE